MLVGVYGLGRFGSFFAELLSHSCDVVAASRNRGHPMPKGVRAVSEDEIWSVPNLVLCVAISAMEEVLSRFAGRIPPGTLVMDTCSVKMHPIRLMEGALAPEVGILGTHPMFGPDSARQGTRGLPMILCPSRVSPERLGEWKGLFCSMGLSVSVMTPEAHDKEAAFTQGVAHYIGRVLKDLGIQQSAIATVGFRKLLEIVEQTCNDPWQLFLDLQRYNPYTKEMRLRLKKSLDTVMNAIDS